MKIRFATFNLYQYVEPPQCWYRKSNTYKPSHWEAKKSWIKKRMEEMDADVVGFQEVFSHESLKELMSSVGYPYFATVDDPGVRDEDPLVFDNPVVALASKSPIKAAEPVSVAPSIQEDLPLPDCFDFSRTPLRAEVEVADGLIVEVFVAHLKSKRALVSQPDFEETDSWQDKVREAMRAISRGQTASLLQRGAEASALYHDVTNSLDGADNRLVVVLGDLNDDEDSIALRALTGSGRVNSVADVAYDDLPREAKRAVHQNRLYDAFHMAPNPEGGERPPTFNYKGKDQTLDYILLSNAINPRSRADIGRVVDFIVYDDHLDSDGVGDHKQSDHAQVVAEIEFHQSS